MKKLIIGALLGGAIFVQSGLGADIPYDLILFEGGDKTKLSASIDMQVVGNQLIIDLQNTSDATVSGSFGLLTAIGFNLPANLDISGGTVFIGSGSSVIPPTPVVPGGDVSKEWGYANSAKGGFNDAGAPVNATVSAMWSEVDNQFAAGSLRKPNNNLDGPEFGLVTQDGDPGGLNAIMDSVQITLNFTGTLPDDILDYIQANPVAIGFGSFKNSYTPPVPDGGATMLLLGIGLLGLQGLRRKLSK